MTVFKINLNKALNSNGSIKVRKSEESVTPTPTPSQTTTINSTPTTTPTSSITPTTTPTITSTTTPTTTPTTLPPARFSLFSSSGSPYVSYSGNGNILTPITGYVTGNNISSTSRQVVFTALVDGTIYYNFTASSESGYDYGYFIRGSTTILQISGNENSTGTYPAYAGLTYTILYGKDDTVDVGADRIIINSLYILPITPTPTPSQTPTTTPTTTPTATPTTTPTTGAQFSPMAVMLTTGSSYTVPTGATTMKAWAIGSGGNYQRSAGGTAYKTWNVSSGSSVAYTVGAAVSNTNFDAPGNNTTVTYNGTTITGFGGGRASNGTLKSNGGEFSGGDGGAIGGSTQYLGNGIWAAGAVGGNTSQNIGGYIVFKATDVDGLFAVLNLLGIDPTTNIANINPSNPNVFGAGSYFDKVGGFISGGIGGGNGYGTNETRETGVVILYFT